MFVISTHFLFFFHSMVAQKDSRQSQIAELGGEAGNVSERKNNSV